MLAAFFFYIENGDLDKIIVLTNHLHVVLIPKKKEKKIQVVLGLSTLLCYMSRNSRLLLTSSDKRHLDSSIHVHTFTSSDPANKFRRLMLAVVEFKF